ncbi:type II toxin-antitoxin system Phd/YefM family antitoxin [Microbacterium sp. 18062]|uniref:type II toxin-antitoxin system Phd/YefM family antitoxin n=1 Tax=Microbacterium sp. 18062 TaxID=2681410 RepID=UPI0013587835|nr:type II toxin-antitoxin system prevent-host-death family antitoxin [Microbacterium sp. 18062]
MSAYNILEARNNLSRLVASVESGAEVTLMRRGKPVAKIVPVDRPHTGWTGQQFAEWLAAHPLPPGAGRTAEQIDTDLAHERSSWS